MAKRPPLQGPKQLMSARAQLEMEALARAPAARPSFEFSKSSALSQVFPTSSAGGILVPREVDARIQLTHPALSRSALADQFDSFSISGALGASTVLGGEVPVGKITYYQPGALAVFHNDGVARAMILGFFHVDKGIVHPVRHSITDLAAPGTIAAGVSFANRDGFFVPSGYQIVGIVIAIGAGAIATLIGSTIVLNVHDEVPPGF